MAPVTMKPWTVVFAKSDWDKLNAHHYPGDGDEHGSVLACGVVETDRERRLLVREVLPAVDGHDYVARTAHHTLLASFVSEKVGYCVSQQLAYVAVHNHLEGDSVGFSRTDNASHERGYPALVDITRGGPIGALVLGGQSVAGDIWTANDRAPVEKVVVLGARRQVLFPQRLEESSVYSEMDDRQARIFGADGQSLIEALKVVVVGAGGAGSLLVQALTHLGVGHLVVIDDQVVEGVNLRRIVGSVPADAQDAHWNGTRKVDVARRLAMSINPAIAFDAVYGNVVDGDVAKTLFDADAVFLAADSMQARHVVNAICHQFLLPCFQVGAKVHAPKGIVEDAFAVGRQVGADATCMWCSNLIDRERLQKEALSPDERAAINYMPDVVNPSVITMNMMSTALAMNDFLFTITGLHIGEDRGARRYHFLSREPVTEALPHRTCVECAGRKARGVSAELPTRLRS